MKRETWLLLCDVRSMQNVGAIFRTADGAGISRLILGGVTPAPIDRFGRKNKAVAKAALGAEDYLPWERVANIGSFLRKIKSRGFFLVAIEQSDRAVDYKRVRLPKGNILFVLGSETDGLPAAALKLCDTVAEIPMRGKKESLNVSVAAGVAIFRMLKL